MAGLAESVREGEWVPTEEATNKAKKEGTYLATEPDKDTERDKTGDYLFAAALGLFLTTLGMGKILMFAESSMPLSFPASWRDLRSSYPPIDVPARMMCRPASVASSRFSRGETVMASAAGEQDEQKSQHAATGQDAEEEESEKVLTSLTEIDNVHLPRRDPVLALEQLADLPHPDVALPADDDELADSLPDLLLERLHPRIPLLASRSGLKVEHPLGAQRRRRRRVDRERRECALRGGDEEVEERGEFLGWGQSGGGRRGRGVGPVDDGVAGRLVMSPRAEDVLLTRSGNGQGRIS